MKKKYPDTFEYVYTLDKAGKDWKGKLSLPSIDVNESFVL
jgi:hypothetical protein